LIIIFGMGIGVIDKLLFVYITTDLQGSTSFCGITVAVTVIIEIPLFYYGQVFLKSFGRDLMMGIALGAYIVRVFGYTLLTPETKWWIIPLEILHGAGFSNVWLVAIDYSSSIVPRGWCSTMQTFLRSLYLSVGAGCGAVGGGYLMQNYGACFMYKSYGILVAVFLALHTGAVFSGLFSFNDTSKALALAQGYKIIKDENSNGDGEAKGSSTQNPVETEEEYSRYTSSPPCVQQRD